MQQENVNKAMNKQFKKLKNRKDQQNYQTMRSFTSSYENEEV